MVQKIKSMPLKLWFFLFAITLLVVSVVRLPVVGATDSDFEKLVQQYDRDHIALRAAVRKYHNNMNEIFNRYTKNLLSEDDSFTAAPPENGACDDKNVSTFCLSMEVVDEYIAFITGLETHRDFLTDKVADENADILEAWESAEDRAEEEAAEAGEELEEGDWIESNLAEQHEIGTSQNAIDRYNKRVALIDGQADLARPVLDVALETYDALQLFYPLHQEYAALVKDLEAYRDGLSSVRKQVEKYPAKFHNMTTTDCT